MAKKKKYTPLSDLLGNKKSANEQSFFNNEEFYNTVGQTMSQSLDQELLFQEEKRKNEREAQALLDSYRKESDFEPNQEKEFQAVYKAMEEDIEVAEALQQLEKQEKYAPKNQMESLVANSVTPEENEFYKDIKEERNKLHQKTFGGWVDFIRKQNREEVNKTFGNTPFYGENVTNADRRKWVAKQFNILGNFLGGAVSIPVAYFTGDKLTKEENERYEKLNKTLDEIERPIYETYQTEIQNKIDQIKQQYGIRTKTTNENLGSVFAGGLNASGLSLYTSDQIDGEDLANVVKALDYLEDSKDLWDKGIDNRTQGNFSKIWSGLSYNGDNFLTLGLKDTSRDLGTAFAVGDGEEPLSETAQLRLNSYKDLETAKGTVIDPDDWFGISQGFQETVGFILEMQASMGVTSGVKSLLKKGGKEYANKTIEKLIGNAVENSLLKNVGSAAAGSALMSSTYETAANTYLGENVQRITNDEGEQILVINNAQRIAEAKRLSNTRDVIDERIAHYNSELSKSNLDNEQKKAIKTELDNLTRIKLQLDNEYEQLVDKDGSIKTNTSAIGALAEGYRNTASEFLVEKYVGRWVDNKFMPAIGSRLGKIPGAGKVGQSYRNLSSKVGESVRKTEVGTLTQAIWHSIKPGQIIQSPLGEVAEEMAIQFVPSLYGDYRDQMDELGSSTFYKNVLISTLGLTGGRSVLQTIGSGKAILSMTPEEKESYVKNLRAKGEAKVFYNKIDNMDDKQLAQDIAMNTYGTFFHPSDVLARVANLRNPNKNPGDGTTAEERNKMASNIEKTSFINLALKAVQTGTEKDLVNTLERQMNKSGVSPETKENMQRAIDKVNKYSTILANNSNLFNGDTISNLEINRDMIEESLADINRELSSLDTNLAWEDVSQVFRDNNLPLEVSSIEELFKSSASMLIPSEGYQNADTMKVLDLLFVRDNLLPNSLKEVNDQLKYQKDPANREAIKEARENKRKELEEKAKEEIKTEAVQQVVTTSPPVFVAEEEAVVTGGTEFAYDGQTYTYHENGSMTDSEGNVVEENLQAEIMAGSSGNMMTAEEYQELVEFSKEATPEHNDFDEALYNDVSEIQEGEEHLYFAAEANETPVTERQKQSAQNYLDDIKRRTGKDPNFEDVIVDYIEMAGKERTELLFNGIEKVYRSMGMNTTSAANVYEKYFNVIANVTDAFSENVVLDKQNSAGKDPNQVQASTLKGETEVKKITTPQRKFKPEVNEIEQELGEDRRTVNPTLKLAYNFQDVTFDEETQTFSLNSRNLKPVEENDVVSNRFILDSDFMHKVRQEPNSLKVQVWDNPEQPMENTTWGALKEKASKELSQEEYQEWYADNVPMVVVYTGKESNSQPIPLSAVHRTNWYRPAVISDRNGLEEQQRVIEEGMANTRALRQQVLQTGSLPINLKFKAENSFGQLQFIPEGVTPLSLNESNPDSTIAVFMPDGTFKIDKTNFFEGTVVNAAEAIKSFQPYELIHINQVGTNSDGSPIYFAFQTMNNSPVATHPNLRKPLDSKVHNTLRSVLIASTLLNNRNIPSVVSVIERVYGMTLSKALEIQNEVKKVGYNIVNTDAEPSRTGKDLSAYLNLYTMTSHQGGFSQVINDGSKQNGITFFNRNADGSISYVKKGQTTLFSTGVNRQQTFNLRNHNNINHILNGLAGLLDENNGALSSIKMHVNLSGLTDTKGKSLPVFDNNHNLQEHQTLDSIYKDYLRTNVVSHPIETINGETKYITDVQPMFYFEPEVQPQQSTPPSNTSTIEQQKAEIEEKTINQAIDLIQTMFPSETKETIQKNLKTGWVNGGIRIHTTNKNLQGRTFSTSKPVPEQIITVNEPIYNKETKKLEDNYVQRVKSARKERIDINFVEDASLVNNTPAGKKQKEINAKYDAELAALESKTESTIDTGINNPYTDRYLVGNEILDKESGALILEFESNNEALSYFLDNYVNEKPLVKEGVEELFNENPELANSVYEALGFSNIISENDKIIWGHPGIGKTHLRNSREDIIDFDSDIKPKINEKYGLEDGLEARNEWRKANPELWNEEMRILWEEAKILAIQQNKKLVVSDMLFLKEFAEDFDKIINISKDTFINRSKQRNDYDDNTESWKNNIDNTLKNVKSSKIINTDKYFSDLFITPEQKQQALQAYSQYLDTIFPDSKVKDIVYHGSSIRLDNFSNEKFADTFRDNPLLSQDEIDSVVNSSEGYYFTNNVEVAKTYGSIINKVILNTENLEIIKGNGNNWDSIVDDEASMLLEETVTNTTRGFFQQQRIKNNSKNKGLLFENIIDQGGKANTEVIETSNVIAVHEPEQIHILGSKSDIQGFRDFVKNEEVQELNTTVTDIYGNNHSVSTGDIITYQTETGPIRYILNEEGNMVMLREQPLVPAINTLQGKIDAINSSSLTPEQKNIAIGIVRGLSKNNTEYGSAERFSADEFSSLNTNRIDGLTNEEQKQVVEAVKNLIINSIDFSSALKYSDIKNSIENGVDRFVQEQINQNKEIRDILRSIPGSQSILNDIDTINSKLEKVLEQKEKLIGLNGSLINEFNNIFNTNFYEDAESINEDSENFSQSFLEKDVKLSYSAFLKMSFFGFPKDINNGTNKNTFGFTNYHSADLVNNKLLDISTRVNSSWNTLIDALSDMGEKTKQSLYQEMTRRFESLPEHLKNELLYNVVGRKNTIYKVLNKQGKKVTVKDETGAEYFVIENFEIGVLDENSSRDTVRMFEQVKSDFNSSKIVKNVQGNLFIDVEKAKEVHAKFRQAQIDRNLDKDYLKSLLAEIGIISFSDQTFDYIIDQSVNVPLRGIYGNSGLITQITKHLGYIAKGNKDVSFENYSFIDQISGVIKNTVNVEVMLNKTFMGGSIYVGGKTMQSFIANTSVYDINHKLSTDEGYIEMLQNIPSLRNNFLLKFLIDNPQFREMYREIGFSSPEAYKVDNKDVPDNADFDKIAEQDNLATVLGLFTYTKGAELSENTLGNHPDLTFRKGRLPVHAISDKGRMIYLPTVLLDMQEGDITSTGDRFVLGESVLNFLKEQLFDSELNRILQSYQQDTNIVAYDKSSKVFTLIPSMNSIKIVTENGVTLTIHDVLSETKEGTINPEYMEQIEAQAKQRIEDYINYEVDSKLTAGGTGMLRDLDFYDDSVPDKYAIKNIDTKYVNKKPGSNSIEKLRFTMAEFAINDILHKNNVQQMYLGDLAFYSKDSFIPTKMVNGQIKIDGEQMAKPQVYGNVMIKIGSNLQKRTALLIAPGKKLANSQDPSSTYAQNYVHIALNDTESMSSTMKELIEAQYGLFDEARNAAWSRIEYYKNKIKELENDINPLNKRLIKNMNKRIKSLVAENFSDISDYFNITGTDAQEYLTWQTHLDILLRQGRITREQHDSFKNKIESEELTTEELDIILQPIKPVHTGMIHDKVNNIMRPIYIKSSSFPLLPQLTKNLKIDSLRKAMEKVEKDRKLPVHTSYQSANKIGALKTQLSLEDFASDDYSNALETGVTILPYSDYKIQQETPSKEMKNFLKGKDSHVVMGSQFFKILFGNFINHDNRPIFPNRFSNEILKLAGIEGNKEKLSGAELYNIYQSIYFNYSDTLKSQLENELGLQGTSFVDESTVNQNKIVEKLKNILEKEITNRNYPDYLKDSIQLVQEGLKMELESVMMFDNNRYKFESLLQAVISNRLITHTLPGNGHISASSNGFERKAELDSLTETEKGGIIWLDGIPRELKATVVTRADGKKVLSKSEVLIKAHWKYYDSEGNFKYVDLSDPKYSKDIIEDGKVVGKKLNTNMIDKELLEMFSYRIPTSSHQSGAVIEVAGFLPSEMQDLLVVPKEHTTQFGEDYDIDKRQVYKYNYIVSTEGKIEKLNETHADNFRNYYPTVEEQREMLYEEFQGYLQELKDEKSALKDLLNNESWYSEESSRALFGLITAFDTDREELLNAIRTTSSEISSLYEALSYEQKQVFDNIGQNVRNNMLRKMKIQLLENGLIDTYISLYTTLDSSVQQKIFKPLVTDTADNVANAMQEFLNSEQDYTNFNILSDNYQRYLLKMGADGKGGIGVHSNAVVLEAQMQRLPVQDKVNIDYYFVNSDGDVVRKPFVDSIGDLQFEGNLGQKAKTLDGGRDISDQHGENQNVSTDNISKQIMGKRNENSYTMSVYAFMAHMGFDLSLDNIYSEGKNLGQLHIPSLMLNQPVLRDYTRIRQKYESMTAPYSSDQETAIVEELAALYGYPFDAEAYSLTKTLVDEAEYNTESATLTGQKLFDNLKQSNALKNPLMQMVILQKFLKYQSKARELSEVQQLLNLSTSKLGISYFEVNQRVNKLNEIADLQMEAEESGLVGNNYTKLIGEFTDVPTEGYTKIGKYYWKPTTVEGKMFINSISTANSIMPALFPYDRPAISNMINAIFAVKDLDPNIKSTSNLKLKYDIMSNFVNFVNSDSNIYNNLENERKRLFFDTEENQSLGSILKELRRTNNPIMQNSLLNALTTNLDLATGIMEIKHTLDEQTTLDKSTKYEDFKDLLKDDTVLGVFNGEELRVSDLAQDLISYSLLSNDRNGALGFKNYIPVDFFKIVGDNRKNRNLFNNILHSIEGEGLVDTMENFVKQFFQHNPDKASAMSSANFKKLQEDIKQGQPVRRPRFVSISNTTKPTSLKQFDLYEFDETSNSYKPVPILGSKGMLNEFSFKETNRQSLIAANNPGSTPTNGYLPARGNNIQAKSLDLALQRFTSAKQIAEVLLKTPENYRLKTLLQQILPFIGDNVQVVFVEPNQVKGVAAYSVNEKVIKISKNFYETLNDFHKGNFQQAKERARNILIEEIIHSITVEEVSKYVSSNPVTGEVLVNEGSPAYVRGLVTAYEIARSKVPYDPNNVVSTYGSSNFIEFIANVFTNDSYRQNLEQESTGFIVEFLKAVRNMFKYLQQQATGTYPKYDDIIFQDLLSLLQNDRGIQTTPVDSKKNILAQMKNNNPVAGTNRSLQKQNPTGFYKGLPIINTTEIVNAEGQRGAAQYDRVNKVVKINKPLLQQKYQEKAWTRMRELVETIHGDEYTKELFAELTTLLPNLKISIDNSSRGNGNPNIITTGRSEEDRRAMEILQELNLIKSFSSKTKRDKKQIGVSTFIYSGEVVDNSLLEYISLGTPLTKSIELLQGNIDTVVTSKAQDLPANQFQTYEQFENFVIEHEFQHSIYSRQDFNREFPQGTKGDYETEINKRAIFALGLGIPLDIDKNDLKCN